MPDTDRTFIQLKELFAVNTTQQIGAQDHLDLIESIFQYGGICMPASATPTAGQTIGTDYIKITQFTADTPSSTYLTPAHANDQITIVKGGIFAVYIGLSFSGTNNSTWTGSLHVDGADRDNTNFKRKLSTSGDVGKIGSAGIISLTDGQVVTYYIKADASGKTFVLENGSLILLRVG